MGTPPKQQFNVYLEPALIRRAKYRALDEQRSLSDLVAVALTAHLARAPAVAQEEHTMPAPLHVQPMLHTDDMNASLAFYGALGGVLEMRSRDGDWALLRFGETRLALLAHPGGPDNPEPVELHLASAGPLDAVAAHIAAERPDTVVRGLADEAFGRMMQLRSPEGLVIKLIEVEPGLVG